MRTTASNRSDLEFRYDAMGNRICKIVKPRRGGVGIKDQCEWTYTYYMRDASGNVIATYDRDYSTPGATYGDTLSLTENHLYGSSRIGIRSVNEVVCTTTYTYVGTTNNIYTGTFSARSATAASTTNFNHELRRKAYELSNHLGNVLTTVSDARNPENSGGTITYFKAVTLSAQDYYAFGSSMAGRSYTSSSYRYQFNGKEKDSEFTEGSLDLGARIYESRLGRCLSMDPEARLYSWQTGYSYHRNSPIASVDFNGAGDPPQTIVVKEFSGDQIPVDEFGTLVEIYGDFFKRAMYESFYTKKNGKQKSVERGGVLIKTTVKDETGKVTKVIYSVHNYQVGNSGEADTDFSNLPPGAEVIGTFHTHPYSDREIKREQRLYPNFNGKDVPFSDGDFRAYGDDILNGNTKTGDVQFVVTEEALYGITIVDEEKAKAFLRSSAVQNSVAYSNSKLDDSKDYGDQCWEEILKIAKDYETAHGEGSSGVKFDKKDIPKPAENEEGK